MNSPPFLSAGRILIELQPRGPQLHGRLTGPDGEPVADALVCVDTRPTRRRFNQSARSEQVTAPPYTFSEPDGSFSVEAPQGVSPLTILVIPNREGLAAITSREVRTPKSEDDYSVRVPRGHPVRVHAFHGDGSVPKGRITVGDGRLSYDLVSDPLLAAIPGFLAAHSPRGQSGSRRLQLPEGGFVAVFEPDGPDALKKAQFFRISPEDSFEVTLLVDRSHRQ